MHILTIYCHKNVIKAAVFSAQPEPEFLLGARLVIDNYTGTFSAKVYDEENFRYSGTGYTGAVALERHRQPGGTWPDAVAWLEAWLTRSGFNIVQTVISEHVHGNLTRLEVEKKFRGLRYAEGQDEFMLAVQGWVDYECKGLKGEALEGYWCKWPRPLTKVSEFQLKNLERWVFSRTRS
jgi:hypothetical protein